MSFSLMTMNLTETYRRRRSLCAAAAALLYAAVIVSPLSAGQIFGRTSFGSRHDEQQAYDPYKEVTISGRVIAVNDIEVNNGKLTGVGLELGTLTRTIGVYLGPHVYVDLQTVKISAGDVVDIRGVRDTIGGQDVFLAGEVRRGFDVLTLRDNKGIPLWAGTVHGRVRQY